MAAGTPLAGDPFADEVRQIGNRWGLFLALGIILIILGTLAIMAWFVATLAITLTLGILLAVAGVTEIISAFLSGQWRGFFLQVVLGSLYLVAGVLMIKQPLQAAAAITLVMAIAYMAGGIMRIAFAISHRTVGAGWVLVNGIITLILGTMIAWDWPWDSLFVLGLFVGIDMLFLGWSWVMLALAVKPARA